MRIVHYLARFRLADGGVMRAVIDLCALLAKHDHEVTVVTWDGKDLPAEWKGEKKACAPRVIEVRRPARSALRIAWRVIDSVLDQVEWCDVMHLHTPWDVANLQFARRARAREFPYIVSIHGMLDDWSMAQKTLKKRIFLATGGRRMLERAAAVHCTAAAELEQAKTWFPKGRGVVVPLIFDCTEYNPGSGGGPRRTKLENANTYPGQGPIVLFLSRLHPKKRAEVLIDAAGILRKEGQRFRVLIAGTGDEDYERALKKRVRSAGLEEHVHFIGLVTGAAKVSLFQSSNVFVLPTSQENFGFVYYEALAAGTPVITTRGTDTWRELQESGGAVIVERDDATTFAREIAHMLDDSARA